MRLGSEDKRLPGNHHEVVCHRRIHQYSPHAGEILEEPLVAESLLRLMVQGRLYQNMLYMPGREKELVLGFLLTSGVIERLEDVAELALVPGTPEQPFLAAEVSLSGARTEAFRDKPARLAQAVLAGLPEASERITASAFAGPGPPLQLRAGQLRALVEQLPPYQQLYSLTRATHAILLADPHTGTIIEGAEDVGRHNAFDKVIGQALLDQLALHDKVVVLSGRASFEMVLKAARAGLPIMAAVSAPTLLAVRLAEAQDITLAASIRDHMVKVYSHPDRLVGP
jgi:FdhD protein